MGGGGSKFPKNLTTWYMDGPLFVDKGEGFVTKMITSFMNDPFRIYASLILAGLCNEQVTGVQFFRNICVMTKEIITISDIC